MQKPLDSSVSSGSIGPVYVFVTVNAFSLTTFELTTDETEKFVY